VFLKCLLCVFLLSQISFVRGITAGTPTGTGYGFIASRVNGLTLTGVSISDCGAQAQETSYGPQLFSLDHSANVLVTQCMFYNHYAPLATESHAVRAGNGIKNMVFERNYINTAHGSGFHVYARELLRPQMEQLHIRYNIFQNVWKVATYCGGICVETCSTCTNAIASVYIYNNALVMQEGPLTNVALRVITQSGTIGTLIYGTKFVWLFVYAFLSTYRLLQ
jgi:polygalacturonase